ncbi:MAG: hypothetical protein WBA10_09570 [Elainellaceae cyanobacterium]
MISTDSSGSAMGLEPVPLILYACPTGQLAQQIESYFERSQACYGRNKAHMYMPHCTLTGFFHDTTAAIPDYIHALDEALRGLPSLTNAGIEVRALTFRADWHGLELRSPWLQCLTTRFASGAPSTTRRDALRLKDWLHVSLAYGFDPAHGVGLRSLAEATVDTRSSCGWELRFYQRQPRWVCHWSCRIGPNAPL